MNVRPPGEVRAERLGVRADVDTMRLSRVMLNVAGIGR